MKEDFSDCNEEEDGAMNATLQTCPKYHLELSPHCSPGKQTGKGEPAWTKPHRGWFLSEVHMGPSCIPSPVVALLLTSSCLGQGVCQCSMALECQREAGVTAQVCCIRKHAGACPGSHHQSSAEATVPQAVPQLPLCFGSFSPHPYTATWCDINVGYALIHPSRF